MEGILIIPSPLAAGRDWQGSFPSVPCPGPTAVPDGSGSCCQEPGLLRPPPDRPGWSVWGGGGCCLGDLLWDFHPACPVSTASGLCWDKRRDSWFCCWRFWVMGGGVPASAHGGAGPGSGLGIPESRGASIPESRCAGIPVSRGAAAP